MKKTTQTPRRRRALHLHLNHRRLSASLYIVHDGHSHLCAHHHVGELRQPLHPLSGGGRCRPAHIGMLHNVLRNNTMQKRAHEFSRCSMKSYFRNKLFKAETQHRPLQKPAAAGEGLCKQNFGRMQAKGSAPEFVLNLVTIQYAVLTNLTDWIPAHGVAGAGLCVTNALYV